MKKEERKEIENREKTIWTQHIIEYTLGTGWIRQGNGGQEAQAPLEILGGDHKMPHLK